MSDDPICHCPNVHLRFLSGFNKPLKEVSVAIERSGRKSFVTDGFGRVSYHEENFIEDGKVMVEFDDGGRHLSWDARLPTEPGSYDLHINVWTNDPEGDE